MIFYGNSKHSQNTLSMSRSIKKAFADPAPKNDDFILIEEYPDMRETGRTKIVYGIHTALGVDYRNVYSIGNQIFYECINFHGVSIMRGSSGIFKLGMIPHLTRTSRYRELLGTISSDLTNDVMPCAMRWSDSNDCIKSELVVLIHVPAYKNHKESVVAVLYGDDNKFSYFAEFNDWYRLFVDNSTNTSKISEPSADSTPSTTPNFKSTDNFVVVHENQKITRVIHAEEYLNEQKLAHDTEFKLSEQQNAEDEMRSFKKFDIDKQNIQTRMSQIMNEYIELQQKLITLYKEKNAFVFRYHADPRTAHNNQPSDFSVPCTGTDIHRAVSAHMFNNPSISQIE